MRMKDERGQVYGRLRVVEFAGKTKHGAAQWRCLCECGVEIVAIGNNLRRRLTQSCGCLARERAAEAAPRVSREFAWKRRKQNEIEIDGDVARVHLPDGSVALVDAADVPLIEGYRWVGRCGNGEYVRSSERSDSKPVYLHRLIMGVQDDSSRQVDHVHGDTLDNRRGKLQITSQSANVQKSARRPPKSGYRGVVKRDGRYQAMINVRGERSYLGRFDTAEEAAVAYNAAAREHYGPTAFQNEVQGCVP